MDRRYGPLLSAILIFLSLPSAGWAAPPNHAVALMQNKIAPVMKVECAPSSATVRPGQNITLTTKVQEPSAGLKYSFSTSAGKLYPNGATARLDTAGVSAGTVITATCEVTDALGRRSVADATIRVVGIDLSHAPQAGAAKPPTEMDKVSAAKPPISAGMAGIVGWKSPDSESKAEASAAKPPQHWSASASKAESMPQTATAAPAAPPLEKTDSEAPEASGSGGQAANNAGAHHRTAASPSRAPASVSENGDPYRQAEQVQGWVKQLKMGRVDRSIPPQMKLHEATVVKVVVHGFADTSQAAMPGATTDTLKVSPRMQVQLTAEDNPDEFDIEPKVGEIQFVPIDGTATWMWKVTPKQPATNQTLTVRALLVYPDKGQQIEQEVTSYVAQVNVSVPGVWASLKEAFWNDPSAPVKYLLPGGAGFATLAGLTVWWWRRRHPEEEKTDVKAD